MRSNRFRQNRRTGFAVAVATVLIITLAGGLYLSIKPSGNLPTQTPSVNPTPIPIPFDYRLDISPSNATVMQGNSVQIKVTVTYLQGLPENVTLSLAGVPRIGDYTADYSFSPRQGSPSNESSFNSTLTIHVSGAVPTNTYNITVNSAANNGKTYSSPYTLSVISSEVLLSGRIDARIGCVPTQMIFERLSAAGATIETFTAPVESGQFNITLPNSQWYAVSYNWVSPDGASSGTNHLIPFPYHLYAEVGVTNKKCDFGF